MAEIDALYNQRSQKYSEKERCERKIAELKGKISRLKSFKKSVENYQYEIYQVSLPFCNYSTMCCDDWSGEKYNRFRNEDGANINDMFMRFDDSIDVVLDRVCDEITRLENQVYDYEGWWGDIKSALNSIGNEIEKFFNG